MGHEYRTPGRSRKCRQAVRSIYVMGRNCNPRRYGEVHPRDECARPGDRVAQASSYRAAAESPVQGGSGGTNGVTG